MHFFRVTADITMKLQFIMCIKIEISCSCMHAGIHSFIPEPALSCSGLLVPEAYPVEEPKLKLTEDMQVMNNMDFY